MEPMKNEPGPESSFKRPLLVGKIGRLPKKIQHLSATATKTVPEEENKAEEFKEPAVEVVTLQTQSGNIKALQYDAPSWSGLPDESQTEYVLEVLKNGSIIETIKLTEKPFWVFGRLPDCDIYMQHPTISRHHAVLQYRSDNIKGYYIYDLESTHGTFLNKNRIRPRNYVRMHVGHMLKLGCSTRTYILNGPIEDAEEESELSVTELKEKRQEELRQRDLQKQKEEEFRKKQEEKGIDWGLGEDADEETDLSENPYAETNNEELYLDNPKKALRGFFEREGLDLEYDCNEQGIGQFLCKVELPVDDEMGRSVFAEVIHKGKKKEAVVQCALEACRILDRHGLLRQATHESRKRKPKNWEENDYYDSDDDTFLDRTGTIEKKREMRMNAKVSQKPETYENLLEKENKIKECIKDLELKLINAQKSLMLEDVAANSDVDPLDSFMMKLKQSKPSKQTVNKLKIELTKLKQEHSDIIKLVNIAKPASLPPLVAEYTDALTSGSSEKKGLPMIGKRKKIKLQLPAKSLDTQKSNSDKLHEDDEAEEMEEEKEEEEKKEEKSHLVAESNNSKIKQADTAVEEQSHNEGETMHEQSSEKDKKTDPKIKKESCEDLDEKKKKRNQRRLQQKQERAEVERQKGYAADQYREDYNMWIPPSGQSGDGRTALNDKYGY